MATNSDVGEPGGGQPFAPLSARYGTTGQYGEWREAIEAYLRDQVTEAYALAQEMGAGYQAGGLAWSRMIEGEALTRQNATIVSLRPWLSLEYDASDVHIGEAEQHTIVDACERVAGRLGWNFEVEVRVMIMRGEVDAPWHGARYGYCIDKYPFDKICIPQRAALSHGSLWPVIAHEFTHVVTLNLTQKRIPHWLDEGLAMLMEGREAHPAPEWFDPIELNGAFEGDRRDVDGLNRSQEAYFQSAQLVRYLYRLGGDAKLAQLVRAFTNNNFWTEIRINLLGEPSVEEALHEVYGLSQDDLFRKAHA